MSGKFSFIRNTYGGISKHMWILATAMFINRCGSMVLLFMSVYLTKHMHLSIPQAGVVMAMFGAGSLAGAFAGGKLVDKIGYYPIMIGSLMLSGIMLLILGYMESYLMIAVFTFLVTATGDAFRPANSASISHYSTKEHYPRSIALNRLAMNLGFTIGPVFGGLLASVNYHFLFWADGLTCISAALFIYVVLPKPSKIKEGTYLVNANQEHETAAPTGVANYDSPYKDHFYLGFIICTTLYATAFFQFFTSLPLYYKNEYHLPEKHIGWLMAFNGFGVVLIEMFLIYYIQQKWTQFKFISLGIVLLAAGFLILIPFHGITILILSMFLITLSEMFAMPFMSTYAMTRAPKISMGQYMALYSMGWSTAQILAPVIGTTIIDRYGFNMLWIVLAAIAIISFAGFRWLEKSGATKIFQ